jgi:uncharacterized protein YkwD
MKQLWRDHAVATVITLALGLAGALLVTGLVLYPTNPSPHTVRLIPSAYRAAPTGGGGIYVPGYFTRAYRHHRWCGAPTTAAVRGSHGVFRQRFQHCELAIGPVSVYRIPTGPSGQPTLSTAISTQVTPRSTPQPTRFQPTQAPYVTSTPLPAQSPPSDPVQYELYLMNRTRASLGLPAYSLNVTESNGTATCPGSYGHALHMSQAGGISHDQFPADICVSVRAAGENVGEAGGYSITGALDVIHSEMMAEPIGPGIQNHHTSIVSPSFTQVGIGVVTSGGYTYMCVDFLG